MADATSTGTDPVAPAPAADQNIPQLQQVPSADQAISQASAPPSQLEAATVTSPAPAEATAASGPLQAQADASDTPELTDTSSDADSALGSEYDPSSYTASLTSSITAYKEEHGRRYHAYQEGRYLLPNDEQVCRPAF